MILGMLFCLGLTFSVTSGMKLMIGRPRPNYAALRALVEFGGEDMKVRAVAVACVWASRGTSVFCRMVVFIVFSPGDVGLQVLAAKSTYAGSRHPFSSRPASIW